MKCANFGCNTEVQDKSEFKVCLLCYTQATKEYMKGLGEFCPTLKEFVSDSDYDEVLD